MKFVQLQLLLVIGLVHAFTFDAWGAGKQSTVCPAIAGISPPVTELASSLANIAHSVGFILPKGNEEDAFVKMVCPLTNFQQKKDNCEKTAKRLFGIVKESYDHLVKDCPPFNNIICDGNELIFLDSFASLGSGAYKVVNDVIGVAKNESGDFLVFRHALSQRHKFGSYRREAEAKTEWIEEVDAEMNVHDLFKSPIRGIATAKKLLLNAEPVIIAPVYEKGTLRSFLEQERTTKSEIPLRKMPLDIFSDVAWGLKELHKSDVVHQDIKPENILVDKNGKGFISDFGLARLNAPSWAKDRVKTVSGTPEYMAPELFQGKMSGTPQDMYAFGVMLMDAASGHDVASDCRKSGRDCRGGNLAVYHQRVIRSFRKQIPNCSYSVYKFADETLQCSLLEIAQQCLSLDPKGRPTAEAISEKLEALKLKFKATSN